MGDPNNTHDDDHDDHDVNRTRSFNGRLGQFLHKTPDDATTAPATPTTPNRRQPIMTRSKSLSLPPPTPPLSRTVSPQRPRASPIKRKRRLREPAATATTTILPSRLRDSIPPNLILLLIGVNPGLMTGSTGYAYAHPSNLFWKLLHSSGITTRRHAPSDTYNLPSLYSVGNTNIVERPTRDAGMLSKAEMDAGVPILEAKIAQQRPEAVALVGKSIWESIWRVRHGRAIKKDEFRYGWQDESENMGLGDGTWSGAKVFVATTTSGLAASMSLQEKQEVWNGLGQWVQQRREERRFTPGVAVAAVAVDVET
ncbi:uncharacterized protein TRUGW13939_06628 [Talaromyces rugulosus]|uniref:Uracil-DNA glycosylase-like domain-containing protein n=1 Tax=Talaromyces rugulosus TaxID=121627 RepID=A0A7H8QZC3_TALRU|nr:uncharacterized protein TRUGW13939_06628 [Talaromyces rugulosus]QKX59494.1 hypothetical protein TRUGW13939_06628 [Talaromyces rugulosus]